MQLMPLTRQCLLVCLLILLVIPTVIAITILNPESIRRRYRFSYSVFGTLIMPHPPVISTLMFCGKACRQDFHLESVKGKIGLVERGDCPFQQKVLLLQQNQAIGVVIVNSSDELILLSLDSRSIGIPHIPTVMVTQSDGNSIRSVIDAGIHVVGAIGLDFDEYNVY